MQAVRAAILGVLVVVVLTLAGCGSSGAGSPASTPLRTHAATATITIKNFAYQVSGPVSPDEKVIVRNDDSAMHTVTADSLRAFGVSVSPSATASFTAPRKPGSYPFHCAYHADMHGKLVVK